MNEILNKDNLITITIIANLAKIHQTIILTNKKHGIIRHKKQHKKHK